MSAPLIVAVPKKQPLSHGTAARGKLDAVANVTECASHADRGCALCKPNHLFIYSGRDCCGTRLACVMPPTRQAVSGAA